MSGASRPEHPLDRDKRALARRVRYMGLLDRDPERPANGRAWVRGDLDPPEFRVRVEDVTFYVGLSQVPED